MAIFRCEAQIIGRSAGRSAVAAAAYRAAKCLVDPRTGLVHDFRRKRGVAHSEITLPGLAPDWMQARQELWGSVELGESRKDAQVAREFLLALPIELSKVQQIDLARMFAWELASEGMAVDWSVHGIRSRNPHVHAMASLREVTLEGWSAKKNRAWNQADYLLAIRERWAELSNEALRMAGRRERVSHLSREAQGIAGPGQPKLGPHAAAMERENMGTHRGDALREWRVIWGGIKGLAASWRQRTVTLSSAYTLTAPAYLEAKMWMDLRLSLDKVESQTYTSVHTHTNRQEVARDASGGYDSGRAGAQAPAGPGSHSDDPSLGHQRDR